MNQLQIEKIHLLVSNIFPDNRINVEVNYCQPMKPRDNPVYTWVVWVYPNDTQLLERACIFHAFGNNYKDLKKNMLEEINKVDPDYLPWALNDFPSKKLKELMKDFSKKS